MTRGPIGEAGSMASGESLERARTGVEAGASMAEAGRGRLLGLLFGMNLINFVDRVNVTIVAPLILAELAWDKARLGTVMSATLLGYALGQVPAGLLVDRFGGFWLLAAMCTAWSVATVLTPAAFASFTALLAVRFLLGSFESANNPGQTSINSRAFRPHELARAQAFCFAGTQVGPLVGSPIIAWTAATYSWPVVFYACGVLGLVWVAAWLALARGLPGVAAAAREPALARAGSGTATASAKPSGRELMRALGHPTVRSLAGVGLLWGYAMWLYVSWLPTYLSETWAFSMKEVGWLNAIPTAGSIVAMLAGGVLADRMVHRGLDEARARRRLVGIGLSGSALCTLAAVLAPNATLAIAGFTVAGFVQAIAVAPFYSLPAVLAPQAAGTIAAVLNTCMSLGGVVSPTVGGWLRDASGGWTMPFLTGVGSLLLAGILVLAVVRISRIDPVAADAST
jgi:MFS family permease